MSFIGGTAPMTDGHLLLSSLACRRRRVKFSTIHTWYFPQYYTASTVQRTLTIITTTTTQQYQWKTYRKGIYVPMYTRRMPLERDYSDDSGRPFSGVVGCLMYTLCERYTHATICIECFAEKKEYTEICDDKSKCSIVRYDV